MDARLESRIKEAFAVATDMGMDPGDVRFVSTPASVIYDAASTGLPGHWSHWSSGRNYWLNKRAHDTGLSTIYEMVVPDDPALALLLDTNPEIVNVMVAAHVFGHTHLNRNNAYFRDSNPHILQTVRLWAERVAQYEEEQGDLAVEAFIDKILSLEPYADAKYSGKVFRQPEEPQMPPFPDLLPPKARGDKPKPEFAPAADLYGFLAQYAEGLEDWQRDLLGIYRQRTIFFQPMMRTKVLHEGFAALAHSRIMAKLSVGDDEWLEYSKINSGVMSPHPGGGVNPYWLGHAILKDIEEREGWERVLEVVAVEDDVSLMRNYITERLVHKLNLFSFHFDEVETDMGSKVGAWIVDEKPREWESIRDALILRFSNFGDPVIEIEDYDYEGKRALLLVHRFDGRRLDVHRADKALAAIADVWQQRVCLRTQMRKGPVLATAWAPNEREEKEREPNVAVPTDWTMVKE